MEDIKNNSFRKVKRQIHPSEKENFCSNLFHWWVLKIFFNNYFRKSTSEDIFAPIEHYDSHKLGNHLTNEWVNEVNISKKPSLWRVLIKTFGLEFGIWGIVTLVNRLILIVFVPFLLSKILEYFTTGQELNSDDLIFVIFIMILPFIQVVMHHSSILALGALGMKVRFACSSLLYRKLLRLNKIKFEENASLGQVVNLLSNDMTRFDNAFMLLNYVWVSALEVIATSLILYYQIGFSGVIGVAVILIFLFLQIFFMKTVSSLRSRIALKSEKRIQLIGEIIHGIQFIKMSTWEKKFQELVEDARSQELQLIKTTNYIKLFYISYKQFVVHLSLFLCILAGNLSSVSINAQYVFFTYIYYNMLKTSCSVCVPRALIFFSEINSITKRMQNFLLIEEPESERLLNSKRDTISLVTTNDLCVKWNSASSTNILANVNFQADSNDLIAVVGAAGSGKSTFLQSLINETCIESGEIGINGRISYSSQEPWIFPGSIKQNILFGEVMIEERYNLVIKVCALEHDFSMFPYGDKTLVGERGAMLSGGQKARINVARAIYRNADIYLLDDPLSSVDPQVAKHIFCECISNFLKNKCVILVTHQISLLATVKKMYVLENGKVVALGSYNNLIQAKYVNFLDPLDILETSKPTNSTTLEKINKPEENAAEIKKQSIFIVLKKYMLAGSKPYVWLALLVLFVSTQLVTNAADYILIFWLSKKQSSHKLNEKHHNSTDIEIINLSRSEDCTFVYIYLVIVVVIMLLTFFRIFLFEFLCAKASKHIHNNLLKNLIKTRMQFFNDNPSGQILGRFSKDMGLMDDVLVPTLMDTVQLILNIYGSFLLLAVINYYTVITTGVLFCLTYFATTIFLETFRNIRHKEASTRSRIYDHLTSSLQGLTTIRAFKAENKLIKKFDNQQNENGSIYYTQISLVAGLGFWVDLLVVLYLAALVLGLYFWQIESSVEKIGLMLCQIISLINILQSAIKLTSELDVNLVSVERIQEFSQLTPEEEEQVSVYGSLESWPCKGVIEFHAVNMHYSPENPLVLKKINIKVEAGEKIGIVGRTGSGKSSLISTLFRLFEFEGEIFVDGINTKQISLKYLRKNIGIIPQEPVIFLGTIRKNLDPFNEFIDAEIWKALKKVQLDATISRFEVGIETNLSNGGFNFSVGQKQLLCLARAILRNPKILILDEVTANVDFKTDGLIQLTIRNSFQHATVLTIAHRWQTIMDSDKILVMDKGHVIEFDYPSRLLKDRTSYFYSYVTSCSNIGIEEVREIAKK